MRVYKVTFSKLRSIIPMYLQGIGYDRIASEVDLPIDVVKATCDDDNIRTRVLSTKSRCVTVFDDGTVSCQTVTGRKNNQVSDSDVVKIIDMLISGVRANDIADIYGIAISTVYAIKSGHIHNHLIDDKTQDALSNIPRHYQRADTNANTSVHPYVDMLVADIMAGFPATELARKYHVEAGTVRDWIRGTRKRIIPKCLKEFDFSSYKRNSMLKFDDAEILPEPEDVVSNPLKYNKVLREIRNKTLSRSTVTYRMDGSDTIITIPANAACDIHAENGSIIIRYI